MEALVFANNALNGLYVGNNNNGGRGWRSRYENNSYAAAGSAQKIMSPQPTAAVDVDDVDDGDDKKETKALQKLPNVNRIKEIINKFQHFKLKTVLLAQYPNLQYTEKSADVSLQSNVNALFSGELCEKMRLIESLQIIVRREETFMSEKQKAKFHKKPPRLDKDQKADLKKFYPCLVSLIDALLTYCDPDTRREATVDHIILDVWRGVMSDLNEIFSIIVFGKDTELLELGSYPTDWNMIINERNTKIASIKSAARDVEKEKIKLVEILNTRDREIDNIMAKYANQESQLKLYNSEAQGLAKSLEACTQVTQIVHENLERIKEIQA